MEKVKQREARFIGELVKELCEGLNIEQQLEDSSTSIKRI